MKKHFLPALVLTLLAILCCGDAIAAELHGNPDSKIFHNASCQFYNAKGSTMRFATENAARAAGYKPCKICYDKNAQAGAGYVVNVNSGVFHKKGCVLIKNQENYKTVPSYNEAVARGYKPCDKCLGDKQKNDLSQGVRQLKQILK